MGVFAGADPLGAPFRAAVGGVLGEFVAGHATLLTAVAPQLGSLIELAQVFTAGGKRLRPAFCWWGYALKRLTRWKPHSLIPSTNGRIEKNASATTISVTFKNSFL